MDATSANMTNAKQASVVPMEITLVDSGGNIFILNDFIE
jgi:hypothetical protein